MRRATFKSVTSGFVIARAGSTACWERKGTSFSAEASQWGLDICWDVRSLSSLISVASSVAVSWEVWDTKATNPGKPSLSTCRSRSSVARGMVTVGVAQAAMAKTSVPRGSQIVKGCNISLSCCTESPRGDEDPCVLPGAACFRWWVCWALAVRVGPVRGLQGGGRRGWCEEWARIG